MFQKSLILKKIQLLQNELTLIDSEMEFERKFSTKQKVTVEPTVEKPKSIASPVQTATGKDLSNSLSPVALAKSHEEGSSSSSLDSLNLRPNGDYQNPQKSKVHPLVQSQDCQGIKAYYVVFNGPKAGIYTSWNVAETTVKGISGVKHKKYKSYDEARVSANIYTTAEYKASLELITGSEGLRPSFSTVLTREKDSKIILGTIPRKFQHTTQEILEDMEDYNLDATYTGFKYLYEKGRNTTELFFVDEHYYTTDKRNISYFNFFLNTHPEFVLEVYQYGLFRMIYPSDNLLKLSKFPAEFRNAVKTYKKKCLKGTAKEIFLKIQSSLIFWDDQEEPIQTYKYVQIGVCKDKIYAPSQAKDTLLEKKDLQEIAEQKLLVLINKVFDIRREDKLKVNLATHYCLMTSFSTSSISEIKYEKIREFQKQLVSPFVFGSHYPTLCKKIKIELEKKSINHICQRCDPTTKAKGVMVD
ncbi:hypothetical protein L6452_05615 [Arctium lappa]|uniref:Uncharacterized protein n=1 Tax=Arctium lappa TaxID=4217 RepID=A0ACB9EHM1_ARCLA|nr:hypothetical protein L6452_05615 [Arctium lappa]